MIIIGMAAAANIATRPATEYQTATAEILRPLANANQAINLSLVCIFMN
jgi:hypothetical protein